MLPPGLAINATHRPDLASWVETAQASGFTIQNLPLGVFRPSGTDHMPSIGVAIGDQVLDLRQAYGSGFLDGLEKVLGNGVEATRTAMTLTRDTLNGLMGLERRHWQAVRTVVSDLLSADNPRLRDNERARRSLLIPQAEVEMLLPATVGDYADFYASIHHATRIGRLFRPDQPLKPNYKHLPVGYHGRAGSLVPTGTDVRRPQGQYLQGEAPTFGPEPRLDYEMELGLFTGVQTALGQPVRMAQAPDHMFGLALVNDWSARGIQKWEYEPLGPFLGKSFATSVGPWVVTLDALAPYLVFGPMREADDPEFQPYLRPVHDMALAITVEVYLQSEKMRTDGQAPLRLSQGNFRDMYWTVAQMLVHQTVNGCNLRPGDLLASGTISGPAEDSGGCLLELTQGGKKPIRLPDGTDRTFLADGDEVIMRAYAETDGFARVGFGEVRGRVLPAGST